MTSNLLPREIAPGIFWLSDCLTIEYRGQPLHGYNSVYLVAGDACSMLVEGGHPQDLAVTEAQLDALLASGLPELRYLFTTHSETPHAAGLGRLLSRYPNAVACGDLQDLPLVFPDFRDRMMRMDPGDRIDLGGTEFVAVEAVIRDMPYTRWGFETRHRVLFPGDGFAYSHYHEAGMCGRLAEEVPELDLPDMTALFAQLALYWTQFVDIEPYIERLDELLFDELSVELIAPTHGLPIGDLESVLPRVREGLRLGSAGHASSRVT